MIVPWLWVGITRPTIYIPALAWRRELQICDCKHWLVGVIRHHWRLYRVYCRHWCWLDGKENYKLKTQNYSLSLCFSCVALHLALLRTLTATASPWMMAVTAWWPSSTAMTLPLSHLSLPLSSLWQEHSSSLWWPWVQGIMCSLRDRWTLTRTQGRDELFNIYILYSITKKPFLLS